MSDDFKLTLEFAEQAVIVHYDVYRWSPRVLLALRHDLDRIREEHAGPIVATTCSPADGDWAKFDKFVTAIGFKFHSAIPGLTVFGFQPLYIAEKLPCPR